MSVVLVRSVRRRSAGLGRPHRGTPPDRPATLVDRPRLTALLDKGVARPVTIVSAPAGTGKTTATAAWLAAQAQPGAWLTLRPRHNDQTTLWTAITGVLGPPHPGPHRPAIDAKAALVRSLRRRADPVVLVLDDLHHLTDRRTLTALASLILRCPALRVVACGRWAPPVCFGRLRVGGELAEIGTDALAFTPAEATDLFGRYGVRVPPTAIDGIVDRTGGWVAGLCLAAEAAGSAGADASVLAAFDSARPEAADYLRHEVLGTLPVAVRDDVLRLSHLDRLCPDLVDAVLASTAGARVLDTLRSANLLDPVPAAGRGPSYRWTPIMAPFLRQEARIVLADELSGLHVRASRWLDRHDQPVGAVRHAVEAGLWARAARLVIGGAAARVAASERVDLLGALAAIPDPTSSPPELAATLALARAEAGDGARCLRLAALARARLAGRPAEQRRPVERVVLTAVLAAHRCLGEHAAVIRHAAEASSHDAGMDFGRAPDPGLEAINAIHQGVAHLWTGPAAPTGSLLAAGTRLAQDLGLDLAAADGLAHLALLAAVRGRLAEANRIAGLVLPDARWPGPRRVARLARAVVAWQWLALKQAEVDLAPNDLAGVPTDPTVDLAAAVLRVRVSQAAGDAATSRRELNGLRSTFADHARPGVLGTWLAVAEIEQSILDGRPALDRSGAADPHPSITVAWARAELATGLGDGAARARRLLEPLLTQRAVIADDVRAEAWLTDAHAADRLGLPGAVAVGLAAALDAASAEEAVRPFGTAGRELSALIRDHADLLSVHPRLRRRLESVGRLPATARPPRLEPITEREGVVLRYLPTRLSAREVAAELHVSENTVKTQMKSVYRKLGAANRRDAVDRARRQGVL